MELKTISVTEEVYQELLKIKKSDESFSELFKRMIDTHRQNLEKCFASWDLTKSEMKEIWGNIADHSGRRWSHSNSGHFK